MDLSGIKTSESGSESESGSVLSGIKTFHTKKNIEELLKLEIEMQCRLKSDSLPWKGMTRFVFQWFWTKTSGCCFLIDCQFLGCFRQSVRPFDVAIGQVN